MSVHWDYTSSKSTHLSTSGAPKRSAFSSSLNSGAWTARISAPACTSVYINKVKTKSQFQNQGKHKLKSYFNLPLVDSCHMQGSFHMSMLKHLLAELHSHILHNLEDNHNNLDSIGLDQPDLAPIPRPEIIKEKRRHKIPS